ncbi:MAG: 30S ribosomal protein THX [Cytophagaceae bacterium]
MGKGDKKSKKGKIWRGSFGNSRPRKSASASVAVETKPEAKKPARAKK